MSVNHETIMSAPVLSGEPYVPEGAVSLLRRPQGDNIGYGSPSMIRLPDGSLVAVHDTHYPVKDIPGAKHFDETPGSPCYRSEDNGKSWMEVSRPLSYWANLFLHNGALYLMGTDRQFGNLVILRSTDGGRSWSKPDSAKTGLLFVGGSGTPDAPDYHTSPTPMAYLNGRIYRAFEQIDDSKTRIGWRSFVASAPVDADLLDANNWKKSGDFLFKKDMLPASFKPTPGRVELLEGNAVIAPDGKLVVVLRVTADPNTDNGLILFYNETEDRLEYDTVSSWVRLPGGTHKFVIRRDPQSGRYVQLANANTDGNWVSQRNVLTLSVSQNLHEWELRKELVVDRSGRGRETSLKEIGFQYPDWQFDGDDLIALVRTSYGPDAHWFHDANQITFHRFENFRRWLP